MKITIKKGKHYASGLHLRPYLGKRIITWNIKMDISCLYTAVNDDSGDLNKLCGVSFGHHHKNSLRFAWRPDFNRMGEISIFAYWYTNGQRRSLYIGNIMHNISYRFEIAQHGCSVTFIFDYADQHRMNSKATSVRINHPSMKWGYYLWPYFGGNNTAPHDMTIDLTVE